MSFSFSLSPKGRRRVEVRERSGLSCLLSELASTVVSSSQPILGQGFSSLWHPLRYPDFSPWFWVLCFIWASSPWVPTALAHGTSFSIAYICTSLQEDTTSFRCSLTGLQSHRNRDFLPLHVPSYPFFYSILFYSIVFHSISFYLC